MPGLELSREFHRQVVSPLIVRHFPELPFAAALVGPGSEVLGFDTEVSVDHDWGPRLYLFLSEADALSRAAELDLIFRRALPPAFLGFSTHFDEAATDRTTRMAPFTGGEIRHGIRIGAVSLFVEERLGLAFERTPSTAEWLSFSELSLLEVTAGEVFVDLPGDLTAVRRALDYYPHDVWLYRMASRWARLAEIEPFVGRTGDAGDELGSRLIAASIVRQLMLLSFNIERRYAPYDKWVGTAFRRLSISAELAPHVAGALAAANWREREGALCEAYRIVARAHNALGVTGFLDVEPRRFFDREYRVIDARRFADALIERVEDPEIRERFAGQSWI